MAITSPADMPSILKVRSEPMKKYVLSKLGYPQVAVELSEDQFESIYRVAGDFIAGYFPREQKLSLFWTSPLKSTYPLPKDAYWIQHVSWDPVTSRIDDVFGAESFLFCATPDLKILAADGSLQPILDWKPHWRAKSPFGKTRIKTKDHAENVKRPLSKIRLTYSTGEIEAYSNHIIKANDKWLEFAEVEVGHLLTGQNGHIDVKNISLTEDVTPISIKAVDSGCYYACLDGEPVILH